MEKRLEDFELYTTVRQIGDRIQEIAKKHKCWFDDRRKQSSNPFYDQTAGGLFVEHYYDSICDLWTPWGKWNFIGSSCGDWPSIWTEVSELLGATMHQPRRVSSMGPYGPIFAITRFGGKTLPQAMALERQAYASYDEVHEAWEKLTAQYDRIYAASN
jgi:hypothetical protein